MEVTYILLGRRWHCDKIVMHDGLSNEFFKNQGHEVTLKPLSPKEVNKDQNKMKIK